MSNVSKTELVAQNEKKTVILYTVRKVSTYSIYYYNIFSIFVSIDRKQIKPKNR